MGQRALWINNIDSGHGSGITIIAVEMVGDDETNTVDFVSYTYCSTIAIRTNQHTQTFHVARIYSDYSNGSKSVGIIFMSSMEYYQILFHGEIGECLAQLQRTGFLINESSDRSYTKGT